MINSTAATQERRLKPVVKTVVILKLCFAKKIIYFEIYWLKVLFDVNSHIINDYCL